MAIREAVVANLLGAAPSASIIAEVQILIEGRVNLTRGLLQITGTNTSKSEEGNLLGRSFVV